MAARQLAGLGGTAAETVAGGSSKMGAGGAGAGGNWLEATDWSAPGTAADLILQQFVERGHVLPLIQAGVELGRDIHAQEAIDFMHRTV